MARIPSRRRLGRVSKAWEWGRAREGSGHVWAGPGDRLNTAGSRRKSDWMGSTGEGLLVG